ncbi:hypothetical protein [Nonomuraea sediminis]|uniref:hypothetical protein n=1 Tax=Nonomuraea sediminis TaxID=2835864 RepID=UPI001BDC6A1B|nr:hypothetical protein [Nonomuraea sediminis]
MIKPLVVLDVREQGHLLFAAAFHSRLLDWLYDNGLNPYSIYRLEVYLVDCPSARVYEYARDEDGRLIVDREREDVRRRPPRDVVLSSLPPALPEEET